MAAGLSFLAALLLVLVAAPPSTADGGFWEMTSYKWWGGSVAKKGTCASLPGFDEVRAALKKAVQQEASGSHMWATVVDRSGVICAIAFSGLEWDHQILIGRIISAAKANLANNLALDNSSFSAGSGSKTGVAPSTANAYSVMLPGAPAFGAAEANQINSAIAYIGKAESFGSRYDPLVGKRIGGHISFGGGLALFGPGAVALGGLGLSGDTPCADHRIAWRMRNLLKLDYLAGVAGGSGDPLRPDNIVFPPPNKPASGNQHPDCGDGRDPKTLPKVRGA
jgi:hypothetical protein